MSFADLIRRRHVVNLRQAAQHYVAQGWRVVPGAGADAGRCLCDRVGCHTLGLHPMIGNWETAATSDERQVSAWWAARPKPILLATGGAFEAIEVPGHLGSAVYQRLEDLMPDQPVPVAVMETFATTRWFFFTQRDGALRPELEHRSDIVLHAGGSWVAAPPSKLPLGAEVYWHSQPTGRRWHLPDSYVVQAQIWAVLGRPQLTGASGALW